MDFELEGDRWNHSSLLEEDVDHVSNKPKGFESHYLNQKDYTLNSPLLRDELDELQSFVLNVPHNPLFSKKDWILWKDVLSGLNKTIGRRTWSSRFPTWWSKSLDGLWNVSGFNSWLNQTNKDSKETFIIPKVFLKQWISREVGYRAKRITHDAMLKMGQMFLDFHFVIQAMNSVSKSERDSLGKYCGVGKMVMSGHNVQCFNGGDGSTWIISSDHAYQIESNMMLDRNLMLMVKDTMIARVMTYLTMADRLDGRYSNRDLDNLVDFYKFGDQCLKEHGEGAYNALKMIEPLCIRAISLITREKKPLLQVPRVFEDYMEQQAVLVLESIPTFELLDRHISNEQKIDLLLVYFGSFRHFGHPILDYKEGLRKLHHQVTLPKEIDTDYAQALASDLARKVLHSQFKKTKTWSVTRELVDPDHPFFRHIHENYWPTYKEVDSFGDKWHTLPLAACFDIPDLIDPSMIYSDKSHSLNRKDLISQLERNPGEPLPTKRVLKTLLEEPATDWKNFFQNIDENGIDKDHLMIGLRGKEREMKPVGRFFALMTWRLREYFVSTEYLIKRHFVPLFSGLTMADDLTELIRKMMISSTSQGCETYEQIGIASHVDYEKWNNHQREEATFWVFEVMDKFFGFKSVISRTHEFFKKSLVYYLGRPDLLTPNGDTLETKGEDIMCWEGQDGGLEGLRQKGWSILNMLVIEREKKVRNAKVTLLAQGDNQVITAHYKTETPPDASEEDLIGPLRRITENAEEIMDAIRTGVSKLGLIIKMDETLQSSSLTIYGKIFFIDGRTAVTETKKTSRNTSTVNDQLASYASIIGTVSTNVLTVSHFDTSPVEPILLHNFFSNMCRLLIEKHNPALRRSMLGLIDNNLDLALLEYKWASLYLDPSLGGISGCSLTRFLTRMFPDPLTESLAFWKGIYEGTDDSRLKKFCANCGNPELKKYTSLDFPKLLEDPTSLNLARTVSAQTILKNEVKRYMYDDYSNFKNEIVKEATFYCKENEDNLLSFLESIKPLFPRFLSEFKSATFLGIADSIVGLYQNSRTIRNMFAKRLQIDLDSKIIEGERESIKSICNRWGGRTEIWECSSNHSDYLRESSWASPLVGTTVPHPFEMTRAWHDDSSLCGNDKNLMRDHVQVHIPYGLKDYLNKRGPFSPYLGSKTSESTNIITPWERDTNIPLLKRATKLREVISWFVEPESNLASSILGNLYSLTGDRWDQDLKGFRRTGSALHRFHCQRVSPGGYCATSPSKLTWINSTTDTLCSIGRENYDFIFQSLILYSQVTSGELHDRKEDWGIYHFHVGCKKCLRKIEEVTLDATFEYKPRDSSQVVKRWIPEDHIEPPIRKVVPIPVGDWDSVPHYSKCKAIGLVQGFIVGDSFLRDSSLYKDADLFPLSIRTRLDGRNYFDGILEGLTRAAALDLLYKRSQGKVDSIRDSVTATIHYLSLALTENSSFRNCCRSPNLQAILVSSSHRIPSSYPIRSDDLSLLLRTYLVLRHRNLGMEAYKTSVIWIFADIMVREIMGPMALSSTALKYMGKRHWNKTDVRIIKALRDYVSSLRSKESAEVPLSKYTKNVFRTFNQIRAAMKDCPEADDEAHILEWGEPVVGRLIGLSLKTMTSKEDKFNREVFVPRYQNPMISGLRLFQCSTGTHYKIISILRNFQISWIDAISAGDGSGGITALLLRENLTSRVIFNSLLKLSGVELRGASPAPPSAVEALGESKRRCVNLNTAWQNQSDLRLERTWDSWRDMITSSNLKVNLLIIDAEAQTTKNHETILNVLLKKVNGVLMPGGTLLFKTYLHYLLQERTMKFGELISNFKEVHAVQTIFSASRSSEVYLVCRYRRRVRKEIYPLDRMSIYRHKSIFLCYNSLESEIKRARVVMNLPMFQGIPRELVPDLVIELQILLGMAGFGQEKVVQLADHITTKKITMESLTDWFLMSGTAHHFRAGRSKNKPRPPTLGDCKKGAVIMIGSLISKGLITAETWQIEKAQNIIQSGFYFWWRSWESRKTSQYKTDWRLSRGGLFRLVYLKDKMAGISGVIRTLDRIRRHYRDDKKLKQGALTSPSISGGVLELLRKNFVQPPPDDIVSILPADPFVEGIRE
ncbi:RNA-dependent RNA polymerase [Lepeophtheirus salmonis rhabdovirus 127]|uniref:RNA-directed RNA polymerase L n=1 Tax=Lepeophtheirus salmonis rhabdovirus 127 TaxID=1573761 RepID=A0A0A1EBK8_9RHAB|nr:RNA-dependent RNA polymerase [Lepeophtheirus salmonis rhabdovirus 127]AIY25916.1 RNA-dependent RNA polymerase [Lepeophtheirus salmonis rhabdovirus 127]